MYYITFFKKSLAKYNTFVIIYAIIFVQAKKRGKTYIPSQNNIEQTFDILACIKRNSKGIYQYYFTIKIPYNSKLGKYGA